MRQSLPWKPFPNLNFTHTHPKKVGVSLPKYLDNLI
jgi:hypothetical protein